MDIEVAPLVIDLGYERGEPPTYRAPTRATVPSWFPTALLAVLILICVSASAAPSASPLRPIFRLPVGPADGYTVTDTGQLLAQTFGQLVSYDLATGRIR